MPDDDNDRWRRYREARSAPPPHVRSTVGPVLAVVGVAFVLTLAWVEIVSQPLFCSEDPAGCIALDAIPVFIGIVLLGRRVLREGRERH